MDEEASPTFVGRFNSATGAIEWVAETDHDYASELAASGYGDMVRVAVGMCGAEVTLCGGLSSSRLHAHALPAAHPHGGGWLRACFWSGIAPCHPPIGSAASLPCLVFISLTMCMSLLRIFCSFKTPNETACTQRP